MVIQIWNYNYNFKISVPICSNIFKEIYLLTLHWTVTCLQSYSTSKIFYLKGQKQSRPSLALSRPRTERIGLTDYTRAVIIVFLYSNSFYLTSKE